MNIVFCLYKYFPFGGLQRDFLRIAGECLNRGHSVRVYTLSWQGEHPRGFDIRLVPARGLSSPARYRKFYRYVLGELERDPADSVVGFNKMPGLDIYYAADPCYAYKARYLRSFAYRLTSRYRHFSRYEKAVFGGGLNDGATHILMISAQQQKLFQRYYRTPDKRFHLLPPGIDKSRCAPPDREAVRQEFRREFSLQEDQNLLLLIGSGFKTKGLDRVLLALKNLPLALRNKTRLFVVGQDDPSYFQREAKKLQVADQLEFFSGRDDIPRFLQGADLLIHPAYSENTGTVLLEALVAGLPVLTTANCGYSHFVEEARGGRVIAMPYRQHALDQALVSLLNEDRECLGKEALAWAGKADIYSLPERAADFIERLSPVPGPV